MKIKNKTRKIVPSGSNHFYWKGHEENSNHETPSTQEIKTSHQKISKVCSGTRRFRQKD
jgi:hypothetical protein